MRARVQLLAVGLLLFTRASSFAESPAIKYLLPSGVAPGQATEVTLFGAELGGATSLWTSFDATAEILARTNDQVVFKISLPRSSAAGLGAIRLVATNGISSLHLIMIDALRSSVATGTNHSVATAQQLLLPVAVEGTCEEKTASFFRFSAHKGQRLSFEVVAQRLGSALDPLLRLLDTNGHELVFCEDTPGAGVDGRFSYKFGRTGDYLLELRDTRYEGGRQHRYRLRAGDFPLPPTPLPFLAKPDCRAPASLLPQIPEIEPNDVKPQKITIPACINGRFAKAKDRDCFQFDAAKGERLVFRSRTRSLGSPCDLYLRLENSEGKKLAEAPLAGPDETSLTNTFTESCACQLIVEEAAELNGPEYFYHLEIEPYRPGFVLSVENEKLQAAPDGSVEIKVLQERNNYDGPITLGLEGLGEGYALEKNTITPKTNATPVILKIPASLQPGELVNFRIVGHAQIEGRDCSTTVSSRPALRKLWPHIPWPPAELESWLALGVAEPRQAKGN